ncbi:DUF3618 domain-containing protein [Streptomyces sp. NPDC052687]|uniref:DUF3618 domain-containing protein n=1 Tax=unclassified Streptomyces TaxID=2593676 RepID=UPI001F1109DE|nr:DUF3618 domain-containing protein [Streptomyces sp. JB150]
MTGKGTHKGIGATVAEAASRADVRERARARAADLRDKAGAMTVQLRSSAAQAGQAVQGGAARASHVVEHRAPQPVRRVAQAALRAPRPVLVAGAAGAALVAAGMMRRRGGR